MDASAVEAVGPLRAGAGQEATLELLLYVRSSGAVEMLKAVQQDGKARGPRRETPPPEVRFSTCMKFVLQ